MSKKKPPAPLKRNRHEGPTLATAWPWLMRHPDHWFGFLLAFAMLLTLAGLVFEYGLGVIPCQMCWWQRYVHWALVALAALGWIWPQKGPRFVFVFAFCGAALFGLYIAGWQFAAQHGWTLFPPSCTGEGHVLAENAVDLLDAMQHTKIVPCDKETYRFLGVSLAGWNIPAMLLVLVVAVSGARRIK
jgi:disulfide bond formation protein DsbB